MKYYLSIISILFFLFAACAGKNHIDSKKVEINNSWNFTDSAIFELNTKTETPIKVSLYLNYNDDYPFENIYLRSTIIAQQDTLYREVSSFDLQNDMGEWMGKSKGDSYEQELLITHRINTADDKVTVIIEQYSREQILKGVSSVEVALRAVDN